MSYPFYSFLFLQIINFIPHVSKIKSQFFVRESRLTLPKHLKVLLMITDYIQQKFIIRGDILEQLDLSNLYTIAVQLFKLEWQQK